MKKFYSIVLMATALLIGTNMQAADVTVEGNDLTALQNAITAAGSEGTVTLSAPIVITAGNDASWAGIWIGSEEEDGSAPKITLNLAGNNITIKSGDYKSKGVQQPQNVCPFVITKGELKVVSNSPASIFVQAGSSPLNKNTSVFSVFGTYNRVDPKGANPFSHLFIGENVTVETQNGTGIIVDQLVDGQTAIGALTTKPNYRTNYYKTKSGSARGLAFGALVEVKGQLISQGGTKCYGIKTNGNLACPGDTSLVLSNSQTYFAGLNLSEADKVYAPFVHIYEGGSLSSESSYLPDGSAAAYASGYAQWLIEGKCDGANGLYASSGAIKVDGAEITSHSEEYTTPAGTGHADGAGSAIVVNSRDGYAGAIEIEISGNTKVEATSGFAIEECVKTSEGETKVDAIEIKGGSFQGGTNPATGESQPAIIVSAQTAGSNDAEVVVYGGNIEGPLVVNGDDSKSLDNFLDGDVHTTTIVVDGKNTTVVSAGDAPNRYADITSKEEGKSVYWTGTNKTLQDDITLAELEINKHDTTWNTAHTQITKLTPKEQVLNIGDDTHNVTLIVGRVVLGSKAKVIVNPGSKLIVTGEQGFVAPVASNIVLKNGEGKRSIFLFNPAVTSNTHPNATFEIESYSWRNATTKEAQSEVFAIPTHNAIKNVECLTADKYGYIQVYGTNGAWENIAFTDAAPFPYEKLNRPFAAYALTAYREQSDPKLTFRFGGELVGNDNATLISNLTWSFFANSYTAEVDLDKFLVGLGVSAQSVDKSIYVALSNANGSWYWETLDREGLVEKKIYKLQPMQGFLLHNSLKQVESNSINYKDMVYDPAIKDINDAKKNGAPRRSVIANNYTAKLRVAVTSEAGVYDNVTLRETENTKFAEKYMNEDVNIYAIGEEKSAILVAEDLTNTYVGFSTVKGGKFTISFANVMGREFTLVDHETGARVEIAEGNTYEFNADANSVNDYRFEIVGRQNMPTAIDNTEAVKSAKGVYTITGQYVGEMNVWNTLPAGVYVVNGEKRVK